MENAKGNPFWLNDNLSALLGGRNKKTNTDNTNAVSDGENRPAITPVEVSSSNVDISAIIQPVIIPEPNKKRKSFTVYLSADLLQRFQKAVIADGRKMSPLIVTWITEYLRKREQYEN